MEIKLNICGADLVAVDFTQVEQLLAQKYARIHSDGEKKLYPKEDIHQIAQYLASSNAKYWGYSIKNLFGDAAAAYRSNLKISIGAASDKVELPLSEFLKVVAFSSCFVPLEYRVNLYTTQTSLTMEYIHCEYTNIKRSLVLEGHWFDPGYNGRAARVCIDSLIKYFKALFEIFALVSTEQVELKIKIRS